MLRSAFIAVLALLYVVSTNRALVPLVNYVVNHEYYAERCENKEKPEMECDGCCQVKKQISEETTPTSSEATPEQRRASSNTNEHFELFHLAPSALETAAPINATRCYNLFPTSTVLAGFGVPPFQPPRV
jgi:hypothetical protein